MTQISGWGRHPRVDATVQRPATLSALSEALRSAPRPVLARGLARSYGDASLASHVFDLTGFDCFAEFDHQAGTLECGAGVSLDTVLGLTVPHGWFPAVTPGTARVTIGGAIAADVHGKNHHRVGSFCDHLEHITLMTADGSIERCSLTHNPELFRATAGGMGLTGIIVSARLRLIPVASAFMHETIHRSGDLRDTMAQLEAHGDAPYAVAWLDALAGGRQRGRGLIMLAEHADNGDFTPSARRTRSLAIDAPQALLNRPCLRAFNALNFRTVPAAGRTRLSHYRDYFYPLDKLDNWNRLYGRRGLLQFQCLVPHAAASAALSAMFDALAASGVTAPLAVLKTFGAGNDNYLSFPSPGYTLALDVPRSAAALSLVQRLNAIATESGGRVYLAKDACLDGAQFRRAYPAWEQFETVRARYGAGGRFASLQSARLGLA